MTTNPFYNALAALCYVTAVVGAIYIGSRWAGEEAAENLFIPIGMLSLLVVSVSTMAYIFFYQPIVMLLAGKQKEAVNLFVRTIAIFAGLTFCILVAGLLLFR